MSSYQNCFHLFQPIISIASGKPIGYEALLRSSVETNPLLLFKKAKDSGSMLELDIYSIHHALKGYDQSIPLFLNVFPSTLVSDEFLSLLQKLNISNSVILELNESDEDRHIWNLPLFKRRLDLLRKSNIKCALDDVGTGQASLHKILEFDPDYLKIDRYFAQGLAHSSKKQQVLKFFIDFCLAHHTNLILEGVESESDLKTAKQLGIEYVQGYLYGKPAKIEKDYFFMRRGLNATET